MTITINFAKKDETQSVIDFFEKHVNNNDWVYNKEFLCPYWTAGALIKQEIVIAKDKNEVIWALRFYKQKKDEILSLYQFAVAKDWRWKGLIKEMLKFIDCPVVHSRCFWKSDFNNYYIRTWRNLLKEDKLWKQRQLKL